MLQTLLRWLNEELEFGRLRLLMPVVFGCGILLYFYAPDEPNPWIAPIITAFFAIFAWFMKRFFMRLICLTLMLVSAGFMTASLKAQFMSHPVLSEPTRIIEITGRIEKIERRETNDRFTLYIHEMPNGKLQRVRLVSRNRIAFEVGDDIVMKARLMPPSEPSRPGGYNFARDSWFNGLAAVGFTVGEIKRADPRPKSVIAWFQVKVEHIRTAISNRIRYALAGETGAFADALITGRRDGVTQATQDALRAAGTFHILSISGFHMTLVAAFIFALVRGGFALFPSFSERFNTKAVAAIIAFGVAGFYNILAGSEVATVRSWLMISLVLIGVIFARAAMTLHTLAMAAMVILIVAPETLLSPSFQMSFAATLVLVAGYQGSRIRLLKSTSESSWLMQIGAGFTSGLTGLAVASLFAGLATLPFTAYHFHQIQLYGLFGNVIGAPIIEFFVMPLEIIALLLWPFGLDLLLWPAIGKAIDLFFTTAHMIASWPGNSITIPVFSSLSLAIGALGFILFLILRTALHIIGVFMIIVAVLIAPITEKPFLLADTTLATVAIVSEGKLIPLSEKPVAFILADWKRAYKLEDAVKTGFCDEQGCSYQARNLTLYMPKTNTAFIEECSMSDIIITTSPLPNDCKAVKIEPAAAYYSSLSGFRIDKAQASIGKRIWQRPDKPQVSSSVLAPERDDND